MTDEDAAATDTMFTCVDAFTGRPPSITRAEFTGDSLAVTAQVLLMLNAFDLGELTIPHVPAEIAIHNAIEAMVNWKVYKLPPHVEVTLFTFRRGAAPPAPHRPTLPVGSK